jgi:hypothetical protein
VIYEWRLPQYLFAHVTGDVRIVRSAEQRAYLLVDISRHEVCGLDGDRGIYVFTDGVGVHYDRPHDESSILGRVIGKLTMPFDAGETFP